MTTNCYSQANEPILETSVSKMGTGNLLDDLGLEMRQRVLDEPCMKQPLVTAINPFAKMIQENLMKHGYLDITQRRFVRTRATRGRAKLGLMGCLTNGYIKIKVKGYCFTQSNLIFLWLKGSFPEPGYDIDHINGDPSDDSLTNLRLVSHAINCRNSKRKCNNTSDFAGVYWDKSRSKWCSRVTIGTENVYMGRFLTVEEAFAARQAWIEVHPELGYTARHGF